MCVWGGGGGGWGGGGEGISPCDHVYIKHTSVYGIT